MADDGADDAPPAHDYQAFSLKEIGCDGYKLQLDVRLAICRGTLATLLDPIVSLAGYQKPFTTRRVGDGAHSRPVLTCISTGRSRCFIRNEEVAALFDVLTTEELDASHTPKYLVRNRNTDFFLHKEININRDAFVAAIEVAKVSYVVVQAFGQKAGMTQLMHQLQVLKNHTDDSNKFPYQFEFDLDVEGYTPGFREGEGDVEAGFVLVRIRNPDGTTSSNPLLHGSQVGSKVENMSGYVGKEYGGGGKHDLRTATTTVTWDPDRYGPDPDGARYCVIKKACAYSGGPNIRTAHTHSGQGMPENIRTLKFRLEQLREVAYSLENDPKAKSYLANKLRVELTILTNFLPGSKGFNQAVLARFKSFLPLLEIRAVPWDKYISSINDAFAQADKYRCFRIGDNTNLTSAFEAHRLRMYCFISSTMGFGNWSIASRLKEWDWVNKSYNYLEDPSGLAEFNDYRSRLRRLYEEWQYKKGGEESEHPRHGEGPYGDGFQACDEAPELDPGEDWAAAANVGGRTRRATQAMEDGEGPPPMPVEDLPPPPELDVGSVEYIARHLKVTTKKKDMVWFYHATVPGKGVAKGKGHRTQEELFNWVSQQYDTAWVRHFRGVF